MSSSRESGKKPASSFAHGDLELDLSNRKACYRGRDLDLTDAEFRLLACLLGKPGRAFSRRELIHAMTQGEAIVEERTVDVHIYSLRRKIGEASLIEAVRKVGYRLRTNG